MVEWYDAALLVEGILALGLAGFLVLRAQRLAAPLLLAALLAGFGIIQVERSLHAMGAIPFQANVVTFLVVYPLVTVLSLPIALAMPARPLRGLRFWATVWALIPGAMFVLWFVAGLPPVVDSAGLPTQFDQPMLGIIGSAADVLAAAFFAATWFGDSDARDRKRIGIVVLFLLFWNVHDGLPRAFVTAEGPLQETARALAWLQVLAPVTFALSALARSLAGSPGKPEHRRLFWGFAALLPFAFVQFAPGAPRPQTHLLVDGLALPLLFYGVAKNHVFGIELRLRRSLPTGLIGALAAIVVLVVQQAVEQFFGSRFGWLVGAVLAGIALFALSPLHRLATRFAKRAMPGVEPTEAYREHRRLELYEVALEGLMEDGILEPREARSLAALRSRLGVTPAEHALLERDVRHRLAAGRGAAPQTL